QDTDDRERLSAESSSTTDESRIGTETAPPEALTQYHHVRRRPLVVVPKRSTGERRYSQYIEETCGDRLSGNWFSDTVIPDDGASAPDNGSHSGEAARALAPIQEIERGDHTPRLTLHK